MGKLKVKTVSIQSGKKVKTILPMPCRKVLVKNFSAVDIWVGTSADFTKLDGAIRIPAEAAQALVSYEKSQYGDLLNEIYIMADATEENCVEVQALEW